MSKVSILYEIGSEPGGARRTHLVRSHFLGDILLHGANDMVEEIEKGREDAGVEDELCIAEQELWLVHVVRRG